MPSSAGLSLGVTPLSARAGRKFLHPQDTLWELSEGVLGMVVLLAHPMGPMGSCTIWWGTAPHEDLQRVSGTLVQARAVQ